MKIGCRRRSSRGVALVETALVLPLLVLLMINAVNFGMYLYALVTVNNAARALLEYRVYTGIVVGYPPSPSVRQMQALVTNEVSSLPNAGSVTWSICSNANGAVACEGPGAGFAPSADPVQPARFRMYSARLWYTFQPLFTVLTPLTAGPILRQVEMRSMQ